MRWFPYNRTGALVDGIPDPFPNRTDPDPLAIGMFIPFNILVKLPGGQIILQSNGKIPNYNLETNEIENYQPFDQNIFDSFQITIDQLEGEINLPYVFRREAIFTPASTFINPLTGNETPIPAQTNAIQKIEVPRSQLGGFAQFRINYQYVDITNQEVYTGEVITPRVLVPRRPFIPPPPPPPVFTIDDNQIKEALADKIYEKFFSDPNIDVSSLNIQSLQTTTSDDGIGYKTGRTSDDDQLIFFKKDRNTPENARDFYNDETDENPINQIALHIRNIFANTDANGIIDLSDKLDDELHINTVGGAGSTRTPSAELNPPEYIEGTEASLYYLEKTEFNIHYDRSPLGEIIVPFGELYRFFENEEGDQNGRDPKYKDDEWLNKINLSQLTTPKIGTKVDVNKARNLLDTNIFELLPNQSQRQNEINQFFQKFQALIGPKPNFEDVDGDGAGEQIDDLQLQSRISTADEKESSYITRLNEEADNANTNKTIQSMRDELNQYLGDVDNVIEEFLELPEYENKSEGFLKIRKPNQAIIIRNPVGDLEIEKETEANVDGSIYKGPSWALDGFTITMWVRFLNSTTGGSLMTYGNPIFKGTPGFRLDTNTRSDYNSENEETINRRMVRLVVWDDTFGSELDSGIRQGQIFDSSVGISGRPKYRTFVDERDPAYETFNDDFDVFMQHTQIPTDDLQEWFFICATYDPTIDEEESFGDDIYDGYLTDSQYWLNHKETDGDTVANSGFGNKCKVEVISRSDLLRARGFKV